MKKIIQQITQDYLRHFPKEQERLKKFIAFLNLHSENDITDWNNFEGHIVSSGFVYAKKEQKFLVIYHKDMKMYVYPGGHIDTSDTDPEFSARREVWEETGINSLENYTIEENKLIPLDIDTHKIKINERLNLPSHYHFDFRYLYFIDQEDEVKIDKDESRDYKWIDLKELDNITNCEVILNKLKKIIK